MSHTQNSSPLTKGAAVAKWLLFGLTVAGIGGEIGFFLPLYVDLCTAEPLAVAFILLVAIVALLAVAVLAVAFGIWLAVLKARGVRVLVPGIAYLIFVLTGILFMLLFVFGR